VPLGASLPLRHRNRASTRSSSSCVSGRPSLAATAPRRPGGTPPAPSPQAPSAAGPPEARGACLPDRSTPRPSSCLHLRRLPVRGPDRRGSIQALPRASAHSPGHPEPVRGAMCASASEGVRRLFALLRGRGPSDQRRSGPDFVYNTTFRVVFDGPNRGDPPGPVGPWGLNTPPPTPESEPGRYPGDTGPVFTGCGRRRTGGGRDRRIS
jgi:hypothetical protein